MSAVSSCCSPVIAKEPTLTVKPGSPLWESLSIQDSPGGTHSSTRVGPVGQLSAVTRNDDPVRTRRIDTGTQSRPGIKQRVDSRVCDTRLFAWSGETVFFIARPCGGEGQLVPSHTTAFRFETVS